MQKSFLFLVLSLSIFNVNAAPKSITLPASINQNIEEKKWVDLKLVTVELDSSLKPIDSTKNIIPLNQEFNANNDVIKLSFLNVANDNLIKTLNVSFNNTNIIQKFTSPEQAFNWATQIKSDDNKRYYLFITK